jgi:hypothetical protein
VLRALAARITAQIRGSMTPLLAGGGPVTLADIRKGVAGYMARWRQKGHLLRAHAFLVANDASLRQFWDELTDGIIGSVAAAIDAQRAAGELSPGPPGSRELVRVLCGMLWHLGYDLSMRPHDRAEERRLIDAAATVIHRAFAGVEPDGVRPEPRARSRRPGP